MQTIFDFHQTMMDAITVFSKAIYLTNRQLCENDYNIELYVINNEGAVLEKNFR